MSRAPLSLYRPGRKAPLDVAGLRAHCQQQVAAGHAVQTTEGLLDLVESLAQRLDLLELRLARLAQAQWGRRSEKISGAQLVLALGSGQPEPPPQTPAPELDEAEAPAQPPAPSRPHRPTRKNSRHIPAHIPRTILVSEPPAEQLLCPDCGAPKTRIGTVCSEVLQWEPGGFRAEATHRHKYACRPCQSGVVLGPAPVRVLEQAMPGAGLLAEVVVRKIKDHCPLERQSRIFTQRFGVPLSASTLGEWMAATAQVLGPVAQRLRERALLSAHLSQDDTPIRVLDPAHPKGVKRGHLWAFVSDEPSVFFEYTPSWRGEPIRQILDNYQGTVQGDGYSGLNELFQKEPAPRRAGCLAHARRKFVNAYQAADLRAAFPLQLIQQIYAVEKRATQDGCDLEQRLLHNKLWPQAAALLADMEALKPSAILRLQWRAKLAGYSGAADAAEQYQELFHLAAELPGANRTRIRNLAIAGEQRAQNQAAWASCPGVVITEVIPGAQAQRLGIHAGDIILTYQHQCIDELAKLLAAVQLTTPRESVTLKFAREGSVQLLRAQGGRLGITVEEF